MCNETKAIKVKIPADLSHTGKVFWKDTQIDTCIADIVEALQAAGIDMRSSCCGHGNWGEILLQDGRVLMIQPKEVSKDGLSSKLKEKLCNILKRDGVK